MCMQLQFDCPSHSHSLNLSSFTVAGNSFVNAIQTTPSISLLYFNPKIFLPFEILNSLSSSGLTGSSSGLISA